MSAKNPVALKCPIWLCCSGNRKVILYQCTMLALYLRLFTRNLKTTKWICLNCLQTCLNPLRPSCFRPFFTPRQFPVYLISKFLRYLSHRVYNKEPTESEIVDGLFTLTNRRASAGLQNNTFQVKVHIRKCLRDRKTETFTTVAEELCL